MHHTFYLIKSKDFSTPVLFLLTRVNIIMSGILELFPQEIFPLIHTDIKIELIRASNVTTSTNLVSQVLKIPEHG